MKNYLLLTLIASCPVTTQAMEGQISVARKNERITQLQTELARLQTADIEAPDSPSGHISPITIPELQVVEPHPAPAAQSMQDNPLIQIRTAETRSQEIGRGISITGITILGLGALGYAAWECGKYCGDCCTENDCISNCHGNDACIQKCKNH